MEDRAALSRHSRWLVIWLSELLVLVCDLRALLLFQSSDTASSLSPLNLPGARSEMEEKVI